MLHEGDSKPHIGLVAVGDDSDPTAVYTINTHMEDLIDNLKLLNYETEYVGELKMKPITRHYFIFQTNPGQQFFSFVSLAAWLFRKNGKHFEQPQEYDDPNSVISNILEKLKEMKVDIECPPNKLKQGFGLHAILVLSSLAELGLKASHFMFNRPAVVEKVEEVTTEEGGSEIFLEKVEEEMFNDFSDEERENPMEADDLQLAAMEHLRILDLKRPDKVLEPDQNLDVIAWHAEVERVAPSLKISYKLESSDWRDHLLEASTCRTDVTESLGTATLRIQSLLTEVATDMEKISSKETHAGLRMEKLLHHHKNLKEESSALKATYDSVNGGVKERSKMLSGIHEEIEAMKQEMDERGANMTDGSPLVLMKRAHTNIINENTLMDMRIAVLEHSLLQGRMREKSLMQKEMMDALTKSPDKIAI